MKFIVQSLIFACLQALTVPQITKRGTGPGELHNRCSIYVDRNFCGIFFLRDWNVTLLKISASVLKANAFCSKIRCGRTKL